jgi:YhcH/YjgK/YiaL family protein
MDSRMAIFGPISTVRAQAFPVEKFAACFAYLDELFIPSSTAGERLRGVAIGETKRVELAQGAFALEQAYLSKHRVDGFFESHRKYIDVQVIFEGEELMEVLDITDAMVSNDYVSERDLITYQDASAASVLRCGAGYAAVFYPADVHMPGLSGSKPRALVRKSVIKIPVA